MNERRQWTPQEDRLLKYVFETSKLTKWSQIAIRLQEDYGVKGRSGKQCKERYASHINKNYRKEDWSYEDEQKMVELHNQIGNKWAIIGSKLGGRSDNCVKNHFYSLLKKSLRKINSVIQIQFKKQYKQFTPTILYRLVEVNEEKFKLFSFYQTKFHQYSQSTQILRQELKCQLIQFSYDDEIESEEEIDIDVVRSFISKLNEFAMNYKRKTKKQAKQSRKRQDLLTPTRYQAPEREQSQNNSAFQSSDTSNIEDISDDSVNRSNSYYRRKNSFGSEQDSMEVQKSGINRVRSQRRLRSSFSFTESYRFEIDDNEKEKRLKRQQKMDLQQKIDKYREQIPCLLNEQNIKCELSSINIQNLSLPFSNLIQNEPYQQNYFEQQSAIQFKIVLPDKDLDGHPLQQYYYV